MGRGLDQEALHRDGGRRLFAHFASYSRALLHITGFVTATGQQPEPPAIVDEHFEHENLVSANDGGLQSSISVRHDPSTTGRPSPANASLQYSALSAATVR